MSCVANGVMFSLTTHKKIHIHSVCIIMCVRVRVRVHVRACVRVYIHTVKRSGQYVLLFSKETVLKACP